VATVPSEYQLLETPQIWNLNCEKWGSWPVVPGGGGSWSTVRGASLADVRRGVSVDKESRDLFSHQTKAGGIVSCQIIVEAEQCS
jgi:hypothetical protein